jgi:hypothetical protein
MRMSVKRPSSKQRAAAIRAVRATERFQRLAPARFPDAVDHHIDAAPAHLENRLGHSVFAIVDPGLGAISTARAILASLDEVTNTEAPTIFAS